MGEDGSCRGESQGSMRRSSTALGHAGIPYAVVGGNAVAEWVGRVFTPVLAARLQRLLDTPDG